MTPSTRLQALSELGPLRKPISWDDYSGLGLSCEDLPQLFKLATQPAKSQQEDGHWPAVHALLVIGLLRCPDTSNELIRYLERAPNLYAALSKAGEVVIEPLFAQLQNVQEYNQPFAMLTVTSLALLAKGNPDQRERILGLLTNYLDSSQAVDPLINGSLVNGLVELGASEAIDLIRRRFREGVVNQDVCGDLEDVEMALGLREERETPSLDSLDDLLEDDSHLPWDELLALERHLAQLPAALAIHSLLELEGFLFAIRSAPIDLPIEQWLPAILGGGAPSAAVQVKTHLGEISDFAELLIYLLDWFDPEAGDIGLNGALYPGHLEEDPESVVSDWCRGYRKGLELWPSIGKDDYDFLMESLYPIDRYWDEKEDEDGDDLDELDEMDEWIEDEDEDDWDELEDLADEFDDDLYLAESEEILEEISAAARLIYDHFSQIREDHHQPKVRTQPKVSRNAPCPCGSGKKYKKCCLAD